MSGAPLTVATLLGHDVVALLPRLCTSLSRRTGLELQCEPGDGDRSSKESGVWRHDLVWACGLASLRAIDAARGGTGDGTHGDARASVLPDFSARRGVGALGVGTIVAAPVFTAERSPCYRSLVVARRTGPVRTLEDVAGARVAINERASWSGCHALLAHLLANGLAIGFRAVLRSGSHRRSLAALADRRADAAAIDDGVWRYLEREEPALTRSLRIVACTADWPAPPFLIGHRLDPDRRDTLLEALLALRPDEVPGIDRVEACDSRRYRPLLDTAERQDEIVRAWTLWGGRHRSGRRARRHR